MKTAARAEEKGLDIAFLTSSDDDAREALRALTHAFPGASVTRLAPGSEVPHSASLAMIDTSGLSEAQADLLLETMPDVPALLVVADLTEVRRFSRHMSGTRSIVSRADLGGIGVIQAVHHLLERRKLREQLFRASKHLKEISIRDELTGLYNHRHFNELLTGEVRKANRYRRPLGLVILSIKNFTAINEALGHEEGDRILVAAARAIRDTIREVDLPTRYGDNEFAVILPESEEEAARIVAKRIADALIEGALPARGEREKVKVSTGVAALGEHAHTKDELVKTALGALLEAKRNGAGAICSSNEAMARRREVHENRQLIEQLGVRMQAIARETQLSYFRAIIKALAGIPLVKRQLMPHSERVAFFAQRLAERHGMDGEPSRSLYRAGLLHDIGKLAIDEEILCKPARLSEPEEELMRGHPSFAVQIMGRSSFVSAEIEAIMHHHERFDGSGYPEGLKGEGIPFPARILAIAEAWDTMISPQPYRPEPLTLDSALAELKKGSGSQFDPDLVDRFCALISG